MPTLDIFLHFIIWNNELCLDKVTVYSELETTFYFLSCIPSVLSKAWLQQFHDIQIIRHKALVCMWIRVDLFYVWLTLEERTAMIVKCLDNSNMLEEKAIHGSLVIAFVQKKCNFEPDYLLFLNYLIRLIITVDMMTSWVHF